VRLNSGEGMASNSVVVTIEKTDNFSLLEVNGSDSFLFPDKQKAISPKQFTWVLLLKAYRVLTSLSWLAMAFRTIFVSVKKRISLSDVSEEDPRSRGRLYRFIKVFLVISILALVLEVVAHFKKWNLQMIQPWEVHGLVQSSYMAWLSFRVDYISPFVMLLSKFCVVLFLIQSLDRLVLCLGCFWIKFKKLKPTIEGEAYDIEDSSCFPMVLVQIPMCNEREVRAFLVFSNKFFVNALLLVTILFFFFFFGLVLKYHV
jgi:hypothetical protein